MNQHNVKRQEHGSPPLQWSAKLQEHAQQWADNLAAIDKVIASPEAEKTYNESENLGWITPAKPRCTTTGQDNCYTCGSIIDHWYNEIKNYDFEKARSSNNKPVHHFVQVSVICNIFGVVLMHAT